MMMWRFAMIAVCLVADILLSMIFVTAFCTHRDVLVLRVSWVLAALYPVEIIAMCVFWHKAWKIIQNPRARTTPGKAVGLMFIPLFNLYWAFQLIWGFAKDYNALCRNCHLDRPLSLLPEWYYLTVVIMWVVLVILRYIPLIGHFHIFLILRYNPAIGVLYGMCFSVAMLMLLYKTARAGDKYRADSN